MASIRILLPDQSQAVFEDFEIPDLLREGHVTPETYYWQEGMPEWRPLSEFIEQVLAMEEPAVEAEPAKEVSAEDFSFAEEIPSGEAESTEEAVQESAPSGERRRRSRSGRKEKKKGFFGILFGSGLATNVGRIGDGSECDRAGGGSGRKGRSSSRSSSRRRSRSQSEAEPETGEDSTPKPESAGW